MTLKSKKKSATAICQICTILSKQWVAHLHHAHRALGSAKPALRMAARCHPSTAPSPRSHPRALQYALLVSFMLLVGRGFRLGSSKKHEKCETVTSFSGLPTLLAGSLTASAEKETNFPHGRGYVNSGKQDKVNLFLTLLMRDHHCGPKGTGCKQLLTRWTWHP